MQEALASEQMRPAGEPAIEPKDSQPGEPLEYTATFEIFPEFSGSIQYGFAVSRPQVEITAEDVDGMLDNLRRQRASWTVVERAAQSGDQVTIDFEGSVDGSAFSGNKAKNMPIEIGSGSMIAGFEEQLVGMSAGDEKTLAVNFPDDYPSAEVAGKAASFAVKVHSISERVLPELDDQFAKAFGVAEGGIDALREEVTNNMQRELRGLISSRLKEQVFSGLLENNPVEVPRSLVASEMRQLQSQKGSSGTDPAALEASAERRVKLGVLVSEIVKQNQLQVDPDRVRNLVETIAASYETPEEVVQWYYGNQEMLAGIQSAVIEEQVVDWVVEHGGVDLTEQQTTFNELVEEAKRSQG
jgi:trigger factor